MPQFSFTDFMDITGTFSFAVAGALAAMSKRLDPFGVLILSFVTAIGGGTVSLERKTASAATVSSVNLGAVSLGAFTPQSPTLGSGTAFNTGDVYSFLYDVNLASLGLTGFLVTIEYIASE